MEVLTNETLEKAIGSCIDHSSYKALVVFKSDHEVRDFIDVFRDSGRNLPSLDNTTYGGYIRFENGSYIRAITPKQRYSKRLKVDEIMYSDLFQTEPELHHSIFLKPNPCKNSEGDDDGRAELDDFLNGFKVY